MSLFGAFDQTKHLEELATPLETQEGTLTPATRRARILTNLGVTASLAELNVLDGVTATATELNRAADRSGRLVAVGGTSLTLTEAAHDDRIVALDHTGAASTVTLPAATGTGVKFTLLVQAVNTSNHIVACAGTDEFLGVIYQVDTDTSDAIAAYPALAADNFDTITLNGTTTGGLVGDRIELVDIASGVWSLAGFTNASGSVATPLSAS